MHLKKPNGWTLTRIESLTDCRITRIHNPYIMSKALIIYILRAIWPPKDFSSIRLMHFEAFQIQSLICLPLINPLWLLETSKVIVSTNIFIMILNWKLVKAIDLYCPKLIDLLHHFLSHFLFRISLLNQTHCL